MAKEPVCNMDIDEKTTKYTSEINGNKAYLCSANCRQQLKQNPSKYGYQDMDKTYAQTSISDLPSYFLFIDSILPRYFSL